MNDIINKKFEKLLVISFHEKKLIRTYPTRHKYYYNCLCDCGSFKIIDRDNLLSNHTKSCGCLKKKKGKNNPCWTGFEGISGRFWYSIKDKAESRKLSFNIYIEYAWKLYQNQNGKCAFTNLEISLTNNSTSRLASLDRIDNSVGYEIGNVHWVHKDINWMKGTYTAERFVELCNLVARGNYAC